MNREGCKAILFATHRNFVLPRSTAGYFPSSPLLCVGPILSPAYSLAAMESSSTLTRTDLNQFQAQLSEG